jgi:hypothetical protein
MRNSRTTLLLALTGLALLTAPILAGGSGPEDPVAQAARKASPNARFQARQHLRQAYPGLSSDLHAQLKAQYPELEHALVDAALDTWEAHPGLALEIAKEVESRHGVEITAARQDVVAALEAAYPDFRVRLNKVLEKKGIEATWKGFVRQYDPGLAQEVRSSAPGLGAFLQPGAIRGAFLDGRPSGSRPGLQLLEAFGDREAARRIVTTVRQRAPGLAADFTLRWLDGRQELITALQAEFPGAGKVVADTLQSQHPQLLSEILATVEPRARAARLDLRANIDKRLPGFATQLEGLVVGRYPNLRPELLSILKG